VENIWNIQKDHKHRCAEYNASKGPTCDASVILLELGRNMISHERINDHQFTSSVEITLFLAKPLGLHSHSNRRPHCDTILRLQSLCQMLWTNITWNWATCFFLQDQEVVRIRYSAQTTETAVLAMPNILLKRITEREPNRRGLRNYYEAELPSIWIPMSNEVTIFLP